MKNTASESMLEQESIERGDMNQNMSQLGISSGNWLNANDVCYKTLTMLLDSSLIAYLKIWPFIVHIMSDHLSDLTAIVIFY